MYLVESADDEAAKAAAGQAFKEAVAARDALPKEERGTFRGAAAIEEGLFFEDPAAYDGMSERYAEAQRAVNKASDAGDEARVSYFRLNIHGMGVYLSIMAALGMLQPTSSTDRPAWPAEPEGMDWEQYEALESGAPEEKALVPADVTVYHQAQQAVLRWTPEAFSGICEHKFSSNDGWLVTPEEITTALAAYREHNDVQIKAVLEAAGANPPDYWLKWIAFLELAVTHGGFTVH